MNAKPTPLVVNVDGIPTELIALDRWVVWRYEWREGKDGKPGKWTKPPYVANDGAPANHSDPSTWRTFDAALSDYQDQTCDGIGFVLGDGYAGVDLDHCNEGGHLEKWAQEITYALQSYVETSPSGTGVKIIVKGTLPKGRRKGKIEIYPGARYFTITGHRLNGAGIEARQEQLEQLVTRVFGENGSKPAEKSRPAASPVSLDDHELIAKAKAASTGQKFTDLWAGNWQPWYPKEVAAGRGPSSADLGFCSMLAFWTGNDVARIDRLFRQSGMMREKWNRDDYCARTIAKSLVSEVYTPPTTYDKVTSQQEPPQPDAADLAPDVDQAPEPTPAAWQIFTLADAYEPRPPLVYPVAGLFSLPSLSIVYGAPGTFKSMILAEMCACVAAGMPWLDPLPDRLDVPPVATTQCPALWLDFDNGRRRTHERMDAIGKARDLSPDIPLHYVTMPDPWLDIGSLEALPHLIGLIKRLEVGIVVIDNLGTVSGNADENSTAMVQVMSRFRRLAEESGSAVVLIHHQRKSTGIATRAGESLRGSTSIEASLDLALLVEREEHAESVQMKSTKVRGPDVLPFGAMFTFEHQTGTTELASVRFWGIPIEDLVSDAAIDRAVIEMLDGETLNKTALTTAVKESLPDVGINRIRGRIDWLASRGDIVLTIKDRGAKCYSLPTEMRF